jgi:large subunit ribosomal protein L35
VTKQKLKTHKGAKRRFKVTATGKLMRAKGMKSHFRRRKAPRVKRMFDRMEEVHETNEKKVRTMLPYGS